MSFINYIYRGAKYVLSGIPVKDIRVNVSYTQPNHRLEGKKVVITGGGRGIGLSMAKRFISEGAEVLISGRNKETLENSSQMIGCHYLTLDVQQVETFESFINHAWDLLGGIDCLVNNAGVSHHEKSFEEVSISDFDIQINTNLRGSYFLAQSFVKKYVKEKKTSGNILFVSSERGMMADDLPYGISKAAINSLVQGLAKTLITKGIRVNAIAPGVTTSGMTGVNANDNLFRESQATFRVYLPEEVAETACFLLSDESNLLNGHILVCNEGKSINFRR